MAAELIMKFLAYLSVIAVASAAPTVLPTTLQTCLQKTGASIVYPGNANYEALSEPQNSNYQPHPEVIVIPASTQQVSAAVKCVAAEKGSVKLSPRGGGHSYAAYSFSGQVIIDPSQMKRISINAMRKEVTAQFGQTLGPLATAIGKQGFALPHGTCPTVGIAGHSLGGGWGFPSRKWGWLVDRVVALEFVDVDGNIKSLSSSSTGRDAELWWALRGAGSNNFGVVTAFTFSMEKAPTDIVNYELYFGSETDCAQVLLQVQELGLIPDSLPLELGVEVLLMGRDDTSSSACILQGQYLGKKAAYETAINKILSRLQQQGIKPVQSESTVKVFTNWVKALTDLMGPLEAVEDPLPYYAQSLIDNGNPSYGKDQIALMFKGLRAARQTKNSEPDVSFDLLGPNAKTNLPVATGDMAYIHRQGLFLIQIYTAYIPGFNPPGPYQTAVDQITAITNAIRQSRPASEWHSYQNYIDPHLVDFGPQYYGNALGRLKTLKASADPFTVFDFPQGLGHA